MNILHRSFDILNFVGTVFEKIRTILGVLNDKVLLSYFEDIAFPSLRFSNKSYGTSAMVKHLGILNMKTSIRVIICLESVCSTPIEFPILLLNVLK